MVIQCVSYDRNRELPVIWAAYAFGRIGDVFIVTRVFYVLIILYLFFMTVFSNDFSIYMFYNLIDIL